MIQRIQSIYLLVSMIVWGFLLFVPVTSFSDASGGNWELGAGGITEVATGKAIDSAVLMLALFIFVEILLVLALFSYKRRVLQLRITVLAMLLQVFSYGLIAVYVLQGKKLLQAQPEVVLGTIIPLVAAVGTYFAFRGIRRDILLLQAQDRLR